MSRVFTVLTIFLVSCKIAPNEKSTNESETEVPDSSTGESGDCEPDCECHAPEWVCVPATTEVNIETLCSAADTCPILCDGPVCEGVESGLCQTAHQDFFASASAACIDLLTAAETCYFGLTCAELLAVSECDQAHPCYQPWADFRESGCELDTAPSCE